MILAIKFTTQSIYVSEQSADSKSVRLYRTLQADMPEGAYQKGLIINTTEVSECLLGLLKSHNIRTKKAMVCINGLDCIEKEFEIPLGNKQQMRGMIENELKKSDLLKNDYLFDFTYKKETQKTSNVTTYLMPKQLVQNYIQTLQKAGLTLTKIKPFHDAMDKLARLLRLSEEKATTILAYAESGGIELCMTSGEKKQVYRSIHIDDEDFFSENIYILSAQQSKYVNREPEQEILDKLTENVSKLVQFQSQNSRNHPVNKIILFGEYAQKPGFLKSVEETTGIKVIPCKLSEILLKKVEDEETVPCQYDLVAMSAATIVGDQNEIAFVKQYDEQRSSHITTRDRIPVIIMSGAVALLAVISLVIIGLEYHNRRNILEYEASIEEIITSTQYQDHLIMIMQLEEYKAYNQLCEQYIETLEETKRLESSLIRQLSGLKTEGITIVSYSLQEGVLDVVCKAENQEGPAEYAKSVTEAKAFTAVEYTGFQLETDIEGNTYYSFTLKCMIE